MNGSDIYTYPINITIDIKRKEAVRDMEAVIEKNTLNKSEMMRAGRLSEKQHARKDVLYYIFRDESPVYVGVTNNFERRKSEHFSNKRGKAELNKKLYVDMDKNGIDRYSMYIVFQSYDEEFVDEMEILHIHELRGLGLAELNVERGGGRKIEKYVDVCRDVFLDFSTELREIENECVKVYPCGYLDTYEINLRKMEEMIDRLDFDSLKCITGYKEYSLLNEYEEYVSEIDRDNKSIKNKKDIKEMDYYIRYIALNVGSSYPSDRLFSMVIEDVAIRSDIKERSLGDFFEVVDMLKYSDDVIEKYIGAKILSGSDFYGEIEPLLIDTGYGLNDYTWLLSKITGEIIVNEVGLTWR